MRPRLTSDALILGALLIVTLGIAVFAVRTSQGRQPEADFPARRTTYSPRRGGYQAVYEALRALEYPVGRWRTPLNELKEPGTLIIASPESPITRSEWRGLFRWVSQGSLLIVLTDAGNLFGYDTGVLELVGTPSQDSHPAQPTPPAAAAPALRTRAAFRLNRPDWAPVPANEEEGARFDPNTSARSAETPRAPLTPLYRDASGATVALTNWGRGTVILCSSPWSLSTVGVGQADNFTWLLATLGAYAPRSGVQVFRSSGVQDRTSKHQTPNTEHRTPSTQRLSPIWFDEHHHGYGQARGVLSLLAPIARLGLGQMAVAWLLLAFAASRRFGGRVPDASRVRRSRSEYLSGMASLLARARAVDLAVIHVRRQFMSDATRALGLPRDASEDVLIQAAATRGVDPEQLRSLLERAERLIQEKDRTHQDEALAVARGLAEVRRTISPQRWS